MQDAYPKRHQDLLWDIECEEILTYRFVQSVCALT
jgi:hypothetical protein